MPNETDAHISHELLKWARKKSGLTLAEAAEEMEFTTATLKTWEEGKGFPTIDELFVISDVYGLPVSMFYLSEIPQPPILERDKTAKKAFEYLRSIGFTPEQYYDEWETKEAF